MEQLTRDVALAAMTTLAALGGVWLAGLLAARHRHDDAKRDTYAKFLARVRDAESSLHVRADQANRPKLIIRPPSPTADR